MAAVNLSAPGVPPRRPFPVPVPAATVPTTATASMYDDYADRDELFAGAYEPIRDGAGSAGGASRRPRASLPNRRRRGRDGRSAGAGAGADTDDESPRRSDPLSEYVSVPVTATPDGLVQYSPTTGNTRFTYGPILWTLLALCILIPALVFGVWFIVQCTREQPYTFPPDSPYTLRPGVDDDTDDDNGVVAGDQPHRAAAVGAHPPPSVRSSTRLSSRSSPSVKRRGRVYDDDEYSDEEKDEEEGFNDDNDSDHDEDDDIDVDEENDRTPPPRRRQ